MLRRAGCLGVPRTPARRAAWVTDPADSIVVRRILVIVVGLWLAGGVVLGGVLLIQHMVALPTPGTSSAKLRDQLARELPRDQRWHVMHVMYRSCPCSQRTIEHLLSSTRPAAIEELVVLVDDEGRGHAEDELLRQRGYRVRVITPRELRDEFDLEAAPVLVIARDDGELAYVGGYARHKQGAAFQDAEIVAALRQDDAPASLPVFGCPTSERLARALDPLGLRRP